MTKVRARVVAFAIALCVSIAAAPSAVAGATPAVVDPTVPSAGLSLRGALGGAPNDLSSSATLTVAATDQGIRTFDPTGASPRPLGSLVLPAAAGAVQLAGSVAWTLSGADLLAVSVTDPAAPAVIGRVTLPAGGTALARLGTHVLVATSAGIVSVDAADPSAPAIQATFGSAASGVAVSGSTAYVTGDTGLTVWDVTDPAAPAALGTRAGSWGPVVRIGSDVAVAGSTGIALIDVTDPAAPGAPRGIVSLGSVRALETSGTELFAAIVGDAGGSGGVAVLETSSGSPVLVATHRTGAHTTGSQAVAIARAGDRFVVADRVDGYGVVDGSSVRARQLDSFNLGAPLTAVASSGGAALVVVGTELRTVDPGTGSTIATLALPAAATDITATAGYAYLACGAAGIATVDVRDPAGPCLTDVQGTMGSSRRLAVVAGRLWSADGASGLTVFDLSTPSTPSWVDSGWDATYEIASGDGVVFTGGVGVVRVLAPLGSPNSPLGTISVGTDLVEHLATRGPLLAVRVPGRFAVYDVTDPLASRDVGGYSLVGSGPVLFAGESLYVASPGAVIVHDLATPLQMATRRTQVAVSGVAGLAASDDRVLAAGDFGLTSISIPGPRIGPLTETGPGGALADGTTPARQRIARLGDYDLIPDGPRGLSIVDVGDPTDPTEVARVPLAGMAHAVAVDSIGGRAYVACGENDLAIVDVTEPRAPRLLGSWNAPGTSIDVAVTGSTVALSRGSAGVDLIDVNNPAAPVAVGLIPAVLGSGASAVYGPADGLAIDGTVVHVAYGQGGVQSFDIADPGSPVHLGGVADGHAFGREVAVFTSGGARYLLLFGEAAAGTARVIPLSGSTPVGPAIAAPSLPDVRALAGDGADGLVAAWSTVHGRLDTTDPTAVVAGGTVSAPGIARGVSARGPVVGAISASAGYTTAATGTPASIAISGVTDRGYAPFARPVIAFTGAVATTLTLDSAPFSSGTTVAAEGTHTLAAEARSADGIVSARSLTFVVDATPPTVGLTGVTAGIATSLPVELGMTAADAHLCERILLLDGRPVADPTPVTGEGTRTATALARDAAGNAATATATFVVDRTAPVVSITGVAAATRYGHAVTPVVKVTEARLDTVTATLDGASYRIGDTVSTDGTHTLVVTAVDTAGNVGTSSVTFIVDTRGPGISFTANVDPSGYTSAPVDVHVSVDETTSELMFTLYRDGVPTLSWEPTTLVGDGAYSIGVRAVDLVGNVNTSFFSFTIDTVAPTVVLSPVDGTVVPPGFVPSALTSDPSPYTVRLFVDGVETASPDAIAVEGTHTLQAIAVDAAGNVSAPTSTFRMEAPKPALTIGGVSDGTIYAAPVHPTLDTTRAGSLEATLTRNGVHVPGWASGVGVGTADDATFAITARFVDSEGAVATAAVTFGVDTKAPVLDFTGSRFAGRDVAEIVDGSITNSSAFPRVTVVDGHIASSTITLDGGPLPETETNTEGVHVLHASAIDAIGRSVNTTRRFTIDRTPPVLAFTGLPGLGVVASSPIDLDWTASDLTTVTGDLTLDGAPVATGTVSLITGTHTVSLEARDAAGNVSSISRMFDVDADAPAIAFEGALDSTATLFTNGPSLAPVFTVSDTKTAFEASATLNGAPFTSGETVSEEGGYTLTVRAVDAVGNRASATRRFVIDRTRPVARYLIRRLESGVPTGDPIVFDGTSGSDYATDHAIAVSVDVVDTATGDPADLYASGALDGRDFRKDFDSSAWPAPMILDRNRSSAYARWLAQDRAGNMSTWAGSVDPASAEALFYVRIPGDVTRVSGADRYATAVELSKRSHPATAAAVVIATGMDFPDALAGAPLAAKLKAPVLLTRKAALPAVVGAEIARLKPSRIVILGGTGAISEPVATELGKLGGGGWHAPKPERIEGVDRYDTAGKVAAQVTSGTPGHLAFVASGEGFADALSASAVAARLGAPVLLTRRASVPPKTAAALMRMTALQRIVVAGGEGVVQQATIDAATGDASITVAAGADRYVTSREVARLGMTLTGEPGTLPGTRSVLFVATGRTYADAVAAAPAAAAGGGSLVLTDDVIAGELAAWIAPENLPAADSFHGAVHHVTMMGGLGVLSQGTEDLLRGAVQPLP